MLYLIGIRDFDSDTKLLKIGYSDNWDNRKSQYINHNPLTKFLGEREGDEVLEKLFHLRFKDHQYTDYGNEWFTYSSEIIEGFRNFTESDLLDWIWNNRLKVLDNNYFNESRSIQYRVVERLYSTRKEEDLDWRNKFDNIWDRKLCKEIVFDIVEEIENHTQIDNTALECDFMFRFNSITKWDEKMRIYCDFLDSYYDLFKTTNIGSVPREFQNYVNLLGTKRVKALKYRMNECENEYRIISSQDQFKSHILYTFSVGRYPISEIKVKLQQLYDSLGVKKRAKATDLGEYFEIKSFVTTISSKAVRCIELLKLKD